MSKISLNGLLALTIALVGGAHSASAQYPAYGQPQVVGPQSYGQPQVVGPQSYGQPQVVGPQTYAQPGPVYDQAQGPVGYPQSYGGEIPADAVMAQGDMGGAVPYSEDFGNHPQGLGYPGIISNDGGDQLYPYDQQDPWLHGYWQEIPAYGGYAHYRPYNYKHVLAQTQAAAGWGLDPRMPYSQQFWHRYQERASLSHCPLPAHALDNPNAELDPGVEAERIRRELRDRERRLKTLEQKGF